MGRTTQYVLQHLAKRCWMPVTTSPLRKHATGCFAPGRVLDRHSISIVIFSCTQRERDRKRKRERERERERREREKGRIEKEKEKERRRVKNRERERSRENGSLRTWCFWSSMKPCRACKG